MQIGAITNQIDVAQLALIAFFLFFLGLVFYLQRESNREGVPLENAAGERTNNTGLSGLPSTKTFRLPHGGTISAPRNEPYEPLPMSTSAGFIGAPIEPLGDGMLSGLGPAAYANRADVPDRQFFDGTPRIVPLRLDNELGLAREDYDPRGMIIVGADDEVAGTISDVWVDRSEGVVRYLEVALVADLGGRRVLVPMPMCDIQGHHGRVKVQLIMGEQFANVPALRSPDQITLLEEDKVMAYFGGGLLYASAARSEPLI